MAAVAAERNRENLTGFVSVPELAASERMRRQQLLLIADPGQVRQRERMPVPGELQRPDAVHVVPSGGQVQAAVGVVHRVRQADVDAAQRVDDLDEAQEVDLDEVVDDQAGACSTVFTISFGPPRPKAALILFIPCPGISHPGVSRQADHRDAAYGPPVMCTTISVSELLAGGVADVQPALLALGQPGPHVHAGQQDVQRPALRRARRSRVHPAEMAAHVAGQRQPLPDVSRTGRTARS